MDHHHPSQDHSASKVRFQEETEGEEGNSEDRPASHIRAVVPLPEVVIDVAEDIPSNMDEGEVNTLLVVKYNRLLKAQKKIIFYNKVKPFS